MTYLPATSRYDAMPYLRCGRSGVQLPAISLGLWHNFGGVDTLENARTMVRRAFDLGITHFDLANNYGPPPGSAEATFGCLMAQDLRPFRDELMISTKAGWDMWPGPYGNHGSRKYLVASCDQSLKRMGLEYVDIFYHHRPDPETPLEETLGALDFIVRSGRALYAGISAYSPLETRRAATILRDLGTPCLIHQPKYNLLHRQPEKEGLLDALDDLGLGCIVFSPLAQGLLTDRYLQGIPGDSRAARSHFLNPDVLTDGLLANLKALNKVAAERKQTLAQMALSWVLRRSTVTSALIGASRVSQIEDAVQATRQLTFSPEELATIDDILAGNA